MNSKTTLLLALTLAVLGLSYFGLRSLKPAETTTASTLAPKPQSDVARDLLAEPLGDVVKIVARRGNEELAFEKKAPPEGGPAVWYMSKPAEAKVLSHEMDRIAREAGKIRYEVSYKPGEGAVSPADAGLSPPQSIITLTDAEGKTATIEVGRPVSENETYARKAGDETIVVAKSNLRKLLKAKPIEYRDMQLWNIVPENVARAEVCESPATADQKPECYSFVRDGSQWMMDKPVSAKATAKVDEMVKAVSRLRVSQWFDDDPAKLAIYGLEPGDLRINLTVEEPVATEKKNLGGEETKPEEVKAEEAPPAPPEKKIKHFTLRVANRGPIGEDTKLFVRSGDESAVATIMKSAADKFQPVMSEWRDMQVISADASAATKIELTASGESATLMLKDGKWLFDPEGDPADSHAVTELLAALKGLKAVNFVESADAANAGFGTPQADVRLTIPGSDNIERVTIGGYTDPAKRLLVYVRRGDSGPVAKVKAADVATLIRPPAALRDRTIFSFPADQVSRLTITRPNEFLPGHKQTFTLDKKEGSWLMTAPANAPARADEITKFVNSLSSLKGETVAGEAREATAFGFNDPSATVEITIASPSAGEGASDGNEPATKRLSLTEHDGKIYAMQSEGGSIYELNKVVYNQLKAEFRASESLEFEPKDVERLALKTGGESNTFVRKDGKWTFESEPDLPIDSAKIDKILTDIKGIKAERFAAYSSDSLAPFDLDQAQYDAALTLNPQSQSPEKSITLRTSEKTTNYTSAPAADAPKPATPPSTSAHFATLVGRDGVFLLNSDTIKKIFVPLPELEKK